MKVHKLKIRKSTSFFLIFAFIISIFSIAPISASATIGDTFTIDGLTYSVTDEIYGSYTVSVTGFDNSTTDVVVPEKVTNKNNGIEYTVNLINPSAFSGNTEIKAVSIPGTVKTLESSVFENCSNLKDITLNEGIEVIDGFVFRTTGIEKIKFPKSLKTVSAAAFSSCTSLKEVYINSDVTFSGQVFLKCTNLTDLYCNSSNITFVAINFFRLDKSKITFHGYVGSSVETFATEKGYNFQEIKEEESTTATEPSTEATEPSTEATEPSTEVTEPSTEVTEPSTEATEPSTEVTEPSTEATEPSTEVTEPSTEPQPTTEPDTSIFKWRKINNDTAVEITGIKDEYKTQVNVDIPAEINGLPVTVIGTSAFEYGQVMYLTIPSSVFVINDSAFKYCSNLTTITFAENSQLQKIGNEVFSRNQGAGDSLNSVELPESLKLIGYRAFYNRANLLTVKVYSKDVYFGDAAKGKEVFDLYTGTSNLKLYGYAGSTAETYAAEKGHSFRYLDLNTDELQALYDKAEAIDSSLYTEESYANLTTAMKAAKRMLANKDATPAEVQQCTSDLQTAIDNLEIYVAPTTPIEYIEYILGNTDGVDGIRVTDATIIQKHIAELVTLTGADLLAADINGDGTVSVVDATILQNWLVENESAMGYKIGELIKKEVTPTEPDPTNPTDPEPQPNMFYVPNYVSWLTDMGGKMWVYNDATAEFMIMDYDGEAGCFYTELPAEWSELSLYRTPYETTEEAFDINDPWNDETQSGVILNKWEHLGSRGDYNCYKITGDGEGTYTNYDPNVEPDDERTIYFDNSQTKWSNVYIYGWSFGISNEFIQMEPEGNDIWSYTFYDDLPIDGVKGFLFVNSTSWSGATQTVDLSTEEGKNLFVPSLGGNKLSGKWDVYTP